MASDAWSLAYGDHASDAIQASPQRNPVKRKEGQQASIQLQNLY